MKVLITGGAGFIGSHLADKLLARGDKPFIVDNLVTGKIENVPDVPFWRRDISFEHDCSLIFHRVQPDIIIHAAASYKNPEDWSTDVETNVMGTVNIVKESIKHKVKRFIYLQTSLCYGPPKEKPITLSHPLNPQGSYAISKTAAEWYIMMSGLNYVSFRLANCYGPRNLSGPIPTFYKKIKAEEQCIIIDTRRDFVYVDDLLTIVMDAIDGKGSGIYHISSGGDYYIREIFDTVLNCMSPRIVSSEEKPRGKDDVETILLDPSRTERDFGRPIPTLDLKEGITMAVEWYEKHGVKTAYTHLKDVK